MSMTESKSALRSPWVRGWIGIVLTVVTANSIMIYLAMDGNPGLVVEDYYERGQDYEKNMLARQAKDPGWALEVVAPRAPQLGEPALIMLTLSDQAGLPVVADSVTFFAYRPSDAKQDFAQPMVQEGPGQFSVAVTFPLKGVWDTLVSVRQGEHEVNHAKRLIVSAGQ